MFRRVKPIEQILATAETKSLHRSLGAFQITTFGVGAIIGTGIFVLTAEAAQKAGPAMMISFLIAGFVCAVAALCYAEMASMIPVSGSAYTYAYAVLGEQIAWIVGWALILEYTLAASAVAVGWSGYVVGLLSQVGLNPLPSMLVKGPTDGGFMNLPAAAVALGATILLIAGTRTSAVFNSLLVVVKLSALTAFLVLSIPVMKMENFQPFSPLGVSGISIAAASIFFAFVGFDAVATAAEETKDPQRNMPIGIIGSLGICTIFYLLVAAGVTGAVGAQPIRGPDGSALTSGSAELAAACGAQATEFVVCSREALAFVLREIGWPQVANLLGLAVAIALPSVVLLMMFGQTRVFFVMARDGLLPEVFSRVHKRYKTPHVITYVTGCFVAIFAALMPLGKLADLSNAGTLFAFFLVAVAVMILRKTSPGRQRPFRTPMIFLVGPLAAFGCVYLLVSLGAWTQMLFISWAVVGVVVYRCYGYRRSHLAGGIVESAEIPGPVPGAE